MLQNEKEYSKKTLASHYQGLIKAIKFRGTYYKFDFENDTVDELLRHLIPAGSTVEVT